MKHFNEQFYIDCGQRMIAYATQAYDYHRKGLTAQEDASSENQIIILKATQKAATHWCGELVTKMQPDVDIETLNEVMERLQMLNDNLCKDFAERITVTYTGMVLQELIDCNVEYLLKRIK